MRRVKSDEGFTLIEILVAIGLFSAISIAFYQVLFASQRHSDTSTSIANVSEEARLGFNRMIRDTREGNLIDDAEPTGFNVKVDFDGDGSYANTAGNYEDLTFTYIAGDELIILNGEVLVRGVQQITGQDVFSYSSNLLEYDWNGDGVTTWQELDQAAAHGVIDVGNSNGQLDDAEYPFISSVGFAFRVVQEDRSAEFYGEAQVRNRR